MKKLVIVISSVLILIFAFVFYNHIIAPRKIVTQLIQEQLNQRGKYTDYFENNKHKENSWQENAARSDLLLTNLRKCISYYFEAQRFNLEKNLLESIEWYSETIYKFGDDPSTKLIIMFNKDNNSFDPLYSSTNAITVVKLIDSTKQYKPDI